MTATVTLLIAVFLSSAVAAVFVMVVAGIRAGDRPNGLTSTPNSHLESLARILLRVGVRTGHLSNGEDGERD